MPEQFGHTPHFCISILSQSDKISACDKVARQYSIAQSHAVGLRSPHLLGSSFHFDMIEPDPAVYYNPDIPGVLLMDEDRVMFGWPWTNV